MDIVNDIVDKLNEKGYVSDEKNVEKVLRNFYEALVSSGYWDILDKTIEKSELMKPEVNLENIEIGKKYRIKPVVYMKKSLYNKRVRVEEVKRGETGYQIIAPVLVTVLEGRYKGKTMHISTEVLKII